MQALNRLPGLLLGVVMIVTACDAGTNSPPETPALGEGSTAIADVQGPGATSPLQGQVVTIEGIVTGDFQSGDDDTLNDLGGFYVQDRIADPKTDVSNALFVFDGNDPDVDVSRGDRVTVTGTVQEHFGETQLASVTVAIIGSGDVQPLDVSMPFAATTTNDDDDDIADLERFEGMLLRFPQTLVVTEVFNLERYGSVRLSEGGRLFQFTNTNAPERDAYSAYKKTTALRSIVLDDGRRVNGATPVRFLNAGVTPDNAIRIGDSVTGLVGNLRYSRGSGGSGTETWRVMPMSTPAFAADNPRPKAPDVAGATRVASFNVLNYFSTIDQRQDNCGPFGNEGCRGADSAAELSRQLAKITTALTMIDADIVGLIELENNANESLNDIVRALNESLDGDVYAALETGIVGDDVIKTGFIYKVATIVPVGEFAVLDQSVDPRFNDDRNRPALAQTFATTDSGARMTIAVNHLKSKGSDCEIDGDPNVGDGQGNCNQVRTSAARAIVDWLASDPTASDDPDFLIIGDLNAYLREDPLSALKDADYVNLAETATGSSAYSFVFDGQSGALDHALASPSLVPQVAEALDWHINADEAPIHDYNLENRRDPDIFDATTPYRASDHDPVIIGIDLN